MQIQHTKYQADDLKFSDSVLRQPQKNKKKLLYELGDRKDAIIIDYGSETIKSGYAQSKLGPQLVFRPYVSRNRDPSKNDMPIKQAINTSYEQLDLLKLVYKSAFQRNIILHFSILEQCNDYVFSELVRPFQKIRSRLIISQPFANPIHCRTSVLQQFFECYQVQSVMIGVDCLFAYYYQLECRMSRYESESALIVDIGASCIHVFSIIKGKVDWNSIRRINLGGNNSFQLFGKSILLKYPQFKNKLTYEFLKNLYEKFTEVALDYKEQLNYFRNLYETKTQTTYYKNRIQEENRNIQDQIRKVLPIQIDFETVVEIPEEEIRRKEEIKKRMSEKLRQTIMKRKQAKRKILQKQLNDLKGLKQKYDEHDPSAHEQVAQLFGQHHPHDKMIKKIKSLSIKLGLIQQEPEEKKFPLVDIPDSELSSQKIKLKRMQIYQKKALESRQKKLKDKQEEEKQMKDLRENNPEEYLAQLKCKYQALSNRVKQNERIKNQMANRKSRLKQKKMQVLIRLAEDQLDDNFGQNDQDWLVYKDVQQSEHFSQIEAMEAQLRQIDPEWTHSKKDIHNLNSTNQIFLKTQLVKCQQIYFQPRIIGVNQNGLIQCIMSILNQYSATIKQQLIGNIWVVGGGSQVKGLSQRMQRDLKSQCPTQSKIKINISKGGWEGAYLAMQTIAKMQPQVIQKMSFQRREYLEKYDQIKFISNPWSNPQPRI